MPFAKQVAAAAVVVLLAASLVGCAYVSPHCYRPGVGAEVRRVGGSLFVTATSPSSRAVYLNVDRNGGLTLYWDLSPMACTRLSAHDRTRIDRLWLDPERSELLEQRTVFEEPTTRRERYATRSFMTHRTRTNVERRVQWDGKAEIPTAARALMEQTLEVLCASNPRVARLWNKYAKTVREFLPCPNGR